MERFLRAVQRGGVWHLEPADVLTPRARSWEEWHVGYGVDLRPDGVWGQDGADPGVLVISRYRPSTDTTAVFLANVDEDAVEDLETLSKVRAVGEAHLPGRLTRKGPIRRSRTQLASR